MRSLKSLRPCGSAILPEDTSPKFFARHFSAYHFIVSYVNEKDILEVGFGDGYGSNFLAKYARSIKAVDVLRENVRFASNKYKRPNLEFQSASATNLHFAEESFDVVLSFQVIEHIDETSLIKYLTEMKRVLKKSGIAFISTLNLDKNKKPKHTYNKNPFHIKEFTYGEFELLIQKVFSEYNIYGLFYNSKLKFYERLKKIGVFKLLPKPMDIVNRFYNNITVNDFAWKKENLIQCVDFMAVCKKL